MSIMMMDVDTLTTFKTFKLTSKKGKVRVRTSFDVSVAHNSYSYSLCLLSLSSKYTS